MWIKAAKLKIRSRSSARGAATEPGRSLAPARLRAQLEGRIALRHREREPEGESFRELHSSLTKLFKDSKKTLKHVAEAIDKSLKFTDE